MATEASPLADAVIFSVENGFVWAYLPGESGAVALGETGTVTYMMRDFLAQCELGDRLGRPVSNRVQKI